jgi:aryl-alcohol dehydrogenase-like predicted oxidoreductase
VNVPLEETLSAFDELIKTGKVRAIGASNYGAARLKESLETATAKNLPRFQTLQPLYNLYDREDFEQNLKPLCREAGIAVLPYISLARGFLTGKYRSEADFSKSPRGKRMGNYLNERGKKILAALDTVASAYGATPAAVALSWLMNQETVVAPIASATDVKHIKDFATACRFELGDYAAQIIEEASRY